MKTHIKQILSIFISAGLLLLWESQPVLAQRTFNLQTAIPTPSGDFNLVQTYRLKLRDNGDPASAECSPGEVALFGTTLRYCVQDDIWNPISSVWTQDNNTQTVYLSDISDYDLGVAIGTTQKTFKLTLANDGGILANGEFGSGVDLGSGIGTGTRFMWYPRKAALVAGHYDIELAWNDSSFGDYSVALGYNSQAVGAGAIAAGRTNTASGDDSIVMGTGNVADCTSCVVLGNNNAANNTNVGEGYITMFGLQNTATGNGASVLGGSLNIASGLAATTVGGAGNSASGDLSIVLGGASNQAAGTYSLSGGWNMNVTGAQSFAWGHDSSPITVGGSNKFVVYGEGGAATQKYLGVNVADPQYNVDVFGTIAFTGGDTVREMAVGAPLPVLVIGAVINGATGACTAEMGIATCSRIATGTYTLTFDRSFGAAPMAISAFTKSATPTGAYATNTARDSDVTIITYDPRTGAAVDVQELHVGITGFTPISVIPADPIPAEPAAPVQGVPVGWGKDG